MKRKCEFCDRFWRAVITYALPAILIGCVGVVAGWVIAFYWASSL